MALKIMLVEEPTPDFLWVLKFDPTQPRDASGQWTSGGGLSDEDPRTFSAATAQTMTQTYEAWGKDLTPEERGAIDSYTAANEYGPGGHDVINAVLRGRYDAKAKTNADFARIKAKAEANAILITNALNKAPAPPPMLVWRGVTADIGKLIPDLTEGTEVALQGFQSTTLDPQTATSFGKTILEIRPTKGAYLSSLVPEFGVAEHLHGSGETEFLLPHNAHYRVKGVKTVLIGKKPTRVVQLDML